nr:tudor domain-containing protein 5-like isoform X6 [Megalopta genalis]
MQVISQEHESTQTTILALLLSQKGGCTLPQLCKDYYDMEGEEIPWKKLGYVSLMDFIHSMSKSIKIEYSQNTLFLKGIATNKSKHVDKLVTGQKDQKAPIGRKTYKPSHYYPRTLSPKIHIPSEILSMIIDIVNEHPDGINKDFILQKVQISMPYANITMSEMEEQLLVLSHKISVSNNKIFPVQSKSQNFSSKMPIMIASGEEDSDNLLDYAEDDLKFLPPANESTSKKLPAKSKTTSNFIKESVNATQYKSKSNTINDGYNDVTLRAETNESNSYNTYNYNDNVEIYTEDNNYDRVEKETYFGNKHTEDLINSRIKFRLEKLIQNNPDGIWCAELPEKYLEEYKVSLSYTELGFSSVREFASYLPEIFHCVQIDEVGDFMLYYSKKQVPLINPKKKQKTINLAELHQIYLLDEENEALPTTLTPNTCNQLIPEGIVTIGESVGHIHVADLVRIENPYIEVVVVEVFTPSFFWIQLRKKQKAFKKFMNDLNHFYVAKHEDYIIPPVVLEKGLNCACIYNGIWHRGIIKAVKPDLQVTVMFYDYGTLKTYQPIEVYYLHRIFSVLPAQAIPCGLFNTRPYKGIKWTRSATHHFAIKTSDIPLVARITSTNEMDNSMMVTLTDTLEDEDIHINDWLVEQKLAEHGKMVCMKTQNFPFRYYLKCQTYRKQKSEKSKTFQSSEAVEPIKCVTKSSHKLQCLYEKIMNLKLRTRSSNSNSKECNDNVIVNQSLNCDSQLSKKEKPELNNESLGNNIDNNEYDDVSPLQFTKEKKICQLSNEQDDILRNYSSIPKTYAYRFDVQDPEEELNTINPGGYTDMCNGQREFKYMDWSIAEENVGQEGHIIKQKTPENTYKSISEKREKISLAETYFLKAVQNSVHFAERDEDIRWLPNGNINKMEDPSPLVLRNIQKRAHRNATGKTIAIPKNILNRLIEKDSPAEIFESSTISSKSINEASSNMSVQENDSIVNNDSTHPENENNERNVYDENLKIESDSNNTSQMDSYYVCMKPRTIKRELIEILMTKQQESSYSSILDSDDLSGENSSNHDSELNTDDLNNDELNSAETENIDLDTSKSCIHSGTNSNEFSEELESSASLTSLETTSISRSESSKESVSTKGSVSSETSGLAEKLLLVQSPDTEECNLTRQSNVGKESPQASTLQMYLLYRFSMMLI